MALPLEGITVVSLEQAVAAPFATRQLADMGARVIKVERPGDRRLRPLLRCPRRGAFQPLRLDQPLQRVHRPDLKQEDAREVLNRLLEKADVFVQNLAPGATERLGFGTEALRERHPGSSCATSRATAPQVLTGTRRPTTCSSSARPALVSVTGTPETPSKAGIAVADIAAGMYAYSGILAALFRRERTGEGAAIEVSLFEALAEWMGFPAYYALYGDKEPPRSGASHASIAPYGPFACAGGEVVFLGIQNEREWERFCEVVLERAELAEDARFSSNSDRLANREALDREIGQTFGHLTAEEVIEKLEEAGIANARMRSVREFLDHPQLKARDRWREVGSPAGPLHALLPPGLPTDAEPVMAPIPEVGQHTAAILAELGYDEGVLGNRSWVARPSSGV